MNVLLKKILLVALAAASAPMAWSEPPKTSPAKPVPARSVFVIPANVHEGRDPFFPESSRVYDDNKAVSHAVELNTLTCKGVSIEHGHAMVIINNHTFAVGDEGDVLTTGGRVHLRCVAIQADTVIVEVNGSRRELSIGTK